MDDLIQEQIAYYRARADEYDEWWSRKGRYAKGTEFETAWWAEVRETFAWLDDHDMSGDILELAGGTGNYTEYLAGRAHRLTVVDASPEVLAINHRKLAAAGIADRVEMVEADIFDWRPPRRFDQVFFGFWISHVPDTMIPAFFEMVDRALAPGGAALMIDNKGGVADETGVVEISDGRVVPATGLSDRELNDGQTFTIVKVYRSPEQLAALLGPHGWTVVGDSSTDYFTWAAASRS